MTLLMLFLTISRAAVPHCPREIAGGPVGTPRTSVMRHLDVEIDVENSCPLTRQEAFLEGSSFA